jgi:hypothetical protein
MRAMWQAYLDKIVSLKDGSFKVTFEGQELGATDSAALFSLRGQCGWVLFAPNQITAHDVPQEPAREFKAQKSQAQRLRASLWVLWEQRGRLGDFETFYRQEMERLIAAIQEQLEPRL